MAAFRNDGILQWRDSARLANLRHRRSVSRKSRFEYIGEKRRAYAKSGKAKRFRILDEVCETLGCTRKYAIKLLTGNIRYRERKGRGRTYGTSALENVRRKWECVGCPCTTYFVAELPRIVREYEECVALIKPKNQPSAIGCTSYLTNRVPYISE